MGYSVKNVDGFIAKCTVKQDNNNLNIICVKLCRMAHGFQKTPSHLLNMFKPSECIWLQNDTNLQ